jgi:signal transduction histidine kinase
MSDLKTEPQQLYFRPYARLLTMLGDQLIKNERIALVEIIKNSYDADASWVKIIFSGFGDHYELLPGSKIVIEDDGLGMTKDILENHWVNPATPIKKISKTTQPITAKNRRIQGEKGIGRFALLKLGRTISLTTRPANSPGEFVLRFDFSPYDEDFLTENGQAKVMFLADLGARLWTSDRATTIVTGQVRVGARTIERAPHGTKIEITHLQGVWTPDKVELVFGDLVRLQSIFDETTTSGNDRKRADDFEVLIYKDERYQGFSDKYLSTLKHLISDNSVFRIEKGRYDESKREFRFFLNDRPVALSLLDPDIAGMKLFRDYFGADGEVLDQRGTSCGPFSFGFYVFDFSKDAKGKHALDADDKAIIKQHRIYLYRDGIRVYPYGDQDDDWLQIDAYRGTIAAGWFLSNDQVVGVVNITQTENPNLRDKTSREGLIDTGNPTHDFISLLQLFLAWVRKKPYAQYRQSLGDKQGVAAFKEDAVKKAFEGLADKLRDNKQAQSAVHAASQLYQLEKTYLVQRAENTEHLAAVGLSVETASHDIMAVMGRALVALDSLIRQSQRVGEFDKDLLFRDLSALRGMLSFVETQLKNVQLLFKSSRQRRRDIRVREILDKVLRLFDSSLKRDGIEVQIVDKGAPLMARTTDAVLLQVFLNLFDNAMYWLHGKRLGRKKIEILLDGDEGMLIFADNGPGVSNDDAPYIFEPFYSGKGEEGRGLGLYIARQLLERHEYSIEIADLKRHKRLSGANFVIHFVKS